MDHCRHLSKLCLGQKHSILDPSEWHCVVCGTTESVWACLSCTNVACGRYNEEHALKHFKETGHPLAIEVNEHYVFCYDCDDYILNDNVTGDLKFLRDTLEVITKQTFEENAGRSGRRFLRALSVDSGQLKHSHGKEDSFVMKDKGHTALIHRRFVLLSTTFLAWKHLVHGDKVTGQNHQRTPTKVATPKREPNVEDDEEITFKDPSCVENQGVGSSGGGVQRSHTHHKVAKRVQKVVTPIKRKWTVLTPGVTGLRNLGNTCYMNSILQVLSHLLKFRDCFLKVEIDLRPSSRSEVKGQNAVLTNRKRTHEYMRQTTVECFKLTQTPRSGESSSSRVQRHQRQRSPGGGGLNGGSDDTKEAVDPSKCKDPRKVNNNYPLCHELHMLFRVMWSGKWAIVSPHGILSSVWRLIPSFRGYSQQDAQEFLCEFMDKIHSELQGLAAPVSLSLGSGAAVATKEIVPNIFEGWLVSQVMCLKCRTKSNTYEPFWDLSLEFPERYQFSCHRTDISEDTCHLTEMLSKFTEVEHLDGPVYQCEECNSRRRQASGKPVIRTEATKRLLITKLPHVLRLHLKRFRWSGRNHREKIHVPVKFDEELDMRQFCLLDPNSRRILTAEDYMYDLTAAVIHRGFGSGHYTAYSWNHEGGFWVHCNDARLELCSIEDVTACQAYILFYTKRTSVATASTPGKEQEEEAEEEAAPGRMKRRRFTL
ncbi:ubiquitin carboxyl-terminal hydrolase 44-like [Diadema antillarum]|uniref:ubiquitin carboxyl-terminal hydrolase 44-like n=1 Tax=Diadema antillarum TaxID=105358 RepID=UPI003A88720F